MLNESIPQKINAVGYSATGVLLQPIAAGSRLRVVWHRHRATVQLVAGGYVCASVDVPRSQTRTLADRERFAKRLKLSDDD